MPILPEKFLKTKLPDMTKVKQHFDNSSIKNHVEVIKQEFIDKNVSDKILKGQKVLLLIGSRGIHKLDVMVKAIGEEIKNLGAKSYVMPAMGSHGGGTIEGQLEILSEYNITKENLGMEIICTNQTSVVGIASCGTQVKICSDALDFDHIIPIARVKAHTDFRGKIESGICKMLVIGLGKHEGCYTIHKQGFDEFARLIPEAAEIIINNCNVTYGFAIVENAYDETYHIEIVKNKDILKREPQLLKMSKEKMASVLIDEADVLVVEYTGKDISGAGMDPNIIGRTTRGILQGYKGIKYKRLVVLEITDASHGNACGIGVADTTTKKLFDKLDFDNMYPNAIASNNLECAKIPIVCRDEREAILVAAMSCGKDNIEDVSIVRIKDTLSLSEIKVTKNLINYADNCEKLSIL